MKATLVKVFGRLISEAKNAVLESRYGIIVVRRQSGRSGENRLSLIWVTFELRAFPDIFGSSSSFDLTPMGQKGNRRWLQTNVKELSEIYAV